MTHHWDPKQYEKFEKERSQPFYDLLQMLHPLHHPRVLDLGCGNGLLTKFLHESLHASSTLGIDSSKEMLTKAYHLRTDSLYFEEKDIQLFSTDQPFNLVISNAALQWVPDHPSLLEQLTKLLAHGGQLAIQMPANQNYPTHVIAAKLASEEPYNRMIPQTAPLHHLLSMEEYAGLFEKLGYENQLIRMQLYTHFLESTANVIEWVKGSLLTYYKSYLDSSLYSQFLEEYQRRLLQQLGWSEPFFFTMKRLFLLGAASIRLSGESGSPLIEE